MPDMPTKMRRQRVVLLFLVYMSSTSAFQVTPLSTIDLSSLLSRRDDLSCKAVDSRLPDSFKCSEGFNCLSLDNGSSALCCPEGNTCNNISPIPCDVQAQNVTRNGNTSIFTTRLGDKLPTCGDSCCPFGYACIDAPRNQPNSSPVCSLLTGSSKSGTSDTSPSSPSSPSGTSTSSTQSSGPSSQTSTSKTPTSSSSSASTATSGAITNSAQLENTCNKFPPTVFLAGLFPGMFIGAFMMLAWVICSGRHRKPAGRSSAGSSFYKPPISDPIPLHPGGLRTDFLRRTTGRARSMFSAKSGQSPIVGTRDNWKMPTPPVVNNIPLVPSGIPVTPDRRVPRESGTETINVYTPPSGPNVQPGMPTYPPNIAPLRGMNAQRYMDQGSNSNTHNSNAMGSPFETPPNTKTAANHKHSSFRVSNPHHPTDERTVSSCSVVSSLHDHEVLTPARYDGGGGGGGGADYTVTKRMRSTSAGERGRPTTGFTEMLHDVGFPDTYQTTPEVPKIPNGYRSRR
ncbi:uncharacterized protein A1O9_01065 [Exophiala aquamarina CBS 119918]|uniref:Mid2 domain-containing protein n=1 Tax=Exophiala aquamarina CBS 119918 TaxID=1182545 RepID=A0A072PSK1_9EURO|nr:uncharacterized protein A1O9_01065 [Exophiala aquamarina CBS 119918]KEF63089.1 hypothetical protein A1O9_01065 [Exophiala aquamarina CBS 119918]